MTDVIMTDPVPPATAVWRGGGADRERGRVTTGETSLLTLNHQSSETGEDISPPLQLERRGSRVRDEIILQENEKRTNLGLDLPPLAQAPVVLLAKSGKAGSGKLERRERKRKDHLLARVRTLVVGRLN